MAAGGQEPRTVWERSADGLASGMRLAVRGTGLRIGEDWKGGVMLTVRVPAGWHAGLPDGGEAATLLLDPAEARGLATWLQEAADAAEADGPPAGEDDEA